MNNRSKFLIRLIKKLNSNLEKLCFQDWNFCFEPLFFYAFTKFESQPVHRIFKDSILIRPVTIVRFLCCQSVIFGSKSPVYVFSILVFSS